MGLLEKLATGELGVHCTCFEGRIVQQTERSLVLADENELGVVLQVRHLPWQLRLDEVGRAELEQDIERAARVEFERAFHATDHPVTGEPVVPRTRDVTWSPVIESAKVALGAPGWWLLRRLNYAPGDELLVGTWLLPIEDGLFSFALLAKDGMTGLRESALWLVQDEGAGGRPSEHPGQAFFDDPKHDAAFPQHCLSRVRAARQWLEDPKRGALTITRPASHASGEQELAEADCAVLTPPRYARVPAGRLGMSPSLASFTRVTLGDGELPGMLNVWKLPGKAPRGSVAEQLREIALDNAKGWEREGAKNIRVDAEVREGTRGTEARVHVRFEVSDPVQEVQIWFVDRDAVFRIGCSASATSDAQALWRDVDATFASFRRLTAAKRAWWKLG